MSIISCDRRIGKTPDESKFIPPKSAPSAGIATLREIETDINRPSGYDRLQFEIDGKSISILVPRDNAKSIDYEAVRHAAWLRKNPVLLIFPFDELPTEREAAATWRSMLADVIQDGGVHVEMRAAT